VNRVDMVKRVVLVAAVADNGVIGHEGGVPWHLPADLRHFRATTVGNTVVMGRRTYESIGHPLPFRTNVVVTRQAGWSADGVFPAASIEDAVALAEGFDGEVMVIGGAQVYAAAMPLADVQVLTEVHQRPVGDTHYPEFDRSEWLETSREAGDGFHIVRLERAGRTPPRPAREQRLESSVNG
jgi:dihydrofolate reductase